MARELTLHSHVSDADMHLSKCKQHTERVASNKLLAVFNIFAVLPKNLLEFQVVCFWYKSILLHMQLKVFLQK